MIDLLSSFPTDIVVLMIGSSECIVTDIVL